MTRPEDPTRTGAIRRRLRIILSISIKDLKQMHRHGLFLMVFFVIIFFMLGIFLTTAATSEFKKRGTPTWTGSVLGTGEGDVSDDFSVNVAADPMAGPAPLTVSFTSEVSGGKPQYVYRWNYGDGELSSAENPTHTYTNPGIYNCLPIVDDSEGRTWEFSVIRIIVTDPSQEVLQAAISANRTMGNPSLSVGFLSAVAGGTPPYSYSWDFGDNGTSIVANPSHTFLEEKVYQVNLTVTDFEGNVTTSAQLEIEVQKGEGEGGLPFTLLDMAFGLAVLETMIFISLAFSACYTHEMKKGTVRTLVCYPIGVFEITLAKLIYAGIAGLIFSFIVYLPFFGIGKPGGEALLVFFTAYLLSLTTVAIGALMANSLILGLKRMYLRPTTFPYLFVILSFIFTQNILKGIGWFFSLLGADVDTRTFADGFAPLIALSPYHFGGTLLSSLLGGPASPFIPILVVPALLIILGVRWSLKVYPDVYEKE